MIIASVSGTAGGITVADVPVDGVTLQPASPTPSPSPGGSGTAGILGGGGIVILALLIVAMLWQRGRATRR